MATSEAIEALYQWFGEGRFLVRMMSDDRVRSVAVLLRADDSE